MNKKLLIAYNIVYDALLYIYILGIFIPGFCITNSISTATEFTEACLFTSFGAWILSIPLTIASIAIAVFCGIKKSSGLSKHLMINKFALIPFFVMNFVCWGCGIIACLNPFLIIAIPLLMCLSVCFTYVIMFSTSLPLIAYTIRNTIAKRISLGACIVGCVFMFIFCLDAIGAIIITISEAKIAKKSLQEQA